MPGLVSCTLTPTWGNPAGVAPTVTQCFPAEARASSGQRHKRPNSRAKHRWGWGGGIYSAGLPITTFYLHNVQRKDRDLRNTAVIYNQHKANPLSKKYIGINHNRYCIWVINKTKTSVNAQTVKYRDPKHTDQTANRSDCCINLRD